MNKTTGITETTHGKHSSLITWLLTPIEPKASNPKLFKGSKGVPTKTKTARLQLKHSKGVIAPIKAQIQPSDEEWSLTGEAKSPYNYKSATRTCLK
ncbi:hypothetical protein O181_113984 [Austropuccinia psidii MF-1]|uniref:Uncharacterized protein n=1 Tax=Austropuccinia psidii MF-1 TaxID=1389203 RepID=A0A9Q3K6Y4_9BASI|nr:hypothetical protein [Austropuccinia psidii MF-1]